MSNILQFLIIVMIILAIMACAVFAAIVIEYIAQFLPETLANIQSLIVLAFDLSVKIYA